MIIGALFYTHPDSVETVRKVEVMDKMYIADDHSHKGRVRHVTKLTLIVKEKDRIFSITVSPATYYIAEQGKILYFKLDKRDTGEADSSDGWQFFTLFAGVILLLAGLITTSIVENW